MTGKWRRFFLAFLPIVLVSGSSRAEEALDGIDPSAVIEQFDVFGDGDLMLVPVWVFGKTRTFVVDTGSSYQIYDQSLRPFLGAPLKEKTASTLNGKTTVDIFDAPTATLGSLDLRTEWPVACIDFDAIRQISGYEIEGIVGMAFLHQHIVHLNFEAGKLTFLREVPENPGERRHFIFKNATPMIRGQVQDADAQYFKIDTGLTGTVSLNADLFETLKQRGLITAEKNATLIGALGPVQGRDGRLAGLSLAKASLYDLPVSALAEYRSNILGMDIWSRFTITFDFPNLVAYLKPNSNFDRPFKRDLGGMTFIRKRRHTLVRWLKATGPASKAGIQQGDRLLEIDGLDATTARLFTLYIRLCEAGAAIPVKLERGDEVFDVDVQLPDAHANCEAENTRRGTTQ